MLEGRWTPGHKDARDAFPLACVVGASRRSLFLVRAVREGVRPEAGAVAPVGVSRAHPRSISCIRDAGRRLRYGCGPMLFVFFCGLLA